MKQSLNWLGVGLLVAGVAGCNDRLPPPERVDSTRERAFNTDGFTKPLPPQSAEDRTPPPPFSDPPLVSQRTPEEAAFVNAYNAVGRPRILVFVNRTPQVQGNAPVNYDEVAARSLDYAAMENVLTDWLSANGRVAVISPSVGRQLLNDQQTRQLQAGQNNAGRDVANQVDAHILVQVQAQPTQQTPNGQQVRVVAEAIDLNHGGASLARAFVDVPPPLDKPKINEYTRFLARKLMSGMTDAWQTFGAPPPQQQGGPVNFPPPIDAQQRPAAVQQTAPATGPLIRPYLAPQSQTAPSADSGAGDGNTIVPAIPGGANK